MMKKLLLICGMLYLMCVVSAIGAAPVYEWDGSDQAVWVNGGWLNFGNVFEADIAQQVTALGAYLGNASPQWTLPNTVGTTNDVNIKLYELTSLTDVGGSNWDPIGWIIAEVTLHHTDNLPDFSVVTGGATAHFLNLNTPVNLTAGTKYILGMTTTDDPETYISLMADNPGNLNVHGITHIHAAEGYSGGGVINPDSAYLRRGSWIGGPTADDYVFAWSRWSGSDQTQGVKSALNSSEFNCQCYKGLESLV